MKIHGNVKHGHSRSSNGQKSTPEYLCWQDMKARCCRCSHRSYKNYGARGIRVCDRWLNSFENFIFDMGIKPSREHTLERINNNGGYEPSNCRWATMAEQQNNRRNNILITHNKETKSISQWANFLNISPRTLIKRINLGWSYDRVLSTPVNKKLSHNQYSNK